MDGQNEILRKEKRDIAYTSNPIIVLKHSVNKLSLNNWIYHKEP